MRKAKKQPITERGMELLLSKLGGMKADGQDLVAVLNQSVENSWTGVFPIKKPGVRGPHYTEPTLAERNRAATDEFVRRQQERPE
jgi:hypothetical protein